MQREREETVNYWLLLQGTKKERKQRKEEKGFSLGTLDLDHLQQRPELKVHDTRL
jgi:hypothetical protein